MEENLLKLEDQTVQSLLKTDILSHSCTLNNNFELISDLKLASKSINGLKWENLNLDRVGDVTSYLSKNYRELYNKNWNNLAKEIKTNILPVINEKLDLLIQEGRLVENMKSQILFDIMNIVLVRSYSSVCKSEFYEELYQIYISGYIPCGWNGRYPEGNVKVI